jgi:MFS family permease
MTRHFKLNTFSIFGPGLPENVKRMLLTIFVFVIAWGIIEPFIPLYIKSIAPNYTMVGIIFGLLNLFIFLASIPVGDLVDKAKPNKLIKIALVFYTLVGAFYGFAGKISGLILARSFHGISNPLLWVSTESLIRENTTKENSLKAFGWYSTITNFAIVIGSIIGAAAIAYTAITINQLFFALMPFSIASLLLFFKVKTFHKEGEQKEEGITKAIEEIVEKDKVYEKEIKDFLGLGATAIILAIIVFSNSIILHTIYFLIPLLSEDIQLGLPGLALLYGFLHIPFMFCFALAGLADKEGKTKIILIGLLLSAIVSTALFFTTGILLIFVILCFALAFVMALIVPSTNSIISDIIPYLEIGEMTGIYYGISCLGGTIGPILFGIIADLYGLKTVFLASAAIAIVVFLITFACRKKIIIVKDKEEQKSTLQAILEEAKTP